MTDQEIGIAILIGGAAGAFVVWARNLMWRAQERVWHEREIELMNQVAEARREARVSTGLAAAYRYQMHQAGLAYINRQTGREVWFRGSVWTDGPTESQ